MVGTLAVNGSVFVFITHSLHIETRPFIFSFYMIGTSVMKELKSLMLSVVFLLFCNYVCCISVVLMLSFLTLSSAVRNICSTSIIQNRFCIAQFCQVVFDSFMETLFFTSYCILVFCWCLLVSQLSLVPLIFFESVYRLFVYSCILIRKHFFTAANFSPFNLESLLNQKLSSLKAEFCFCD